MDWNLRRMMILWVLPLLLPNSCCFATEASGRFSRDVAQDEGGDQYDYQYDYQYDWDYNYEEERQQLDFGTIRQNQIISLKPSCKYIMYFYEKILSNSTSSSANESPDSSFSVNELSNSSLDVSELSSSSALDKESSNSSLSGSEEDISYHRKDGATKSHKKGKTSVKQSNNQENCLRALIEKEHLQALTSEYVSRCNYEKSFAEVMNMSHVLLFSAIIGPNSTAICIPFIKSCTDQSCESQVSQCNEASAGNQDSGSKAVGRLSDKNAFNVPRQVRSCPEKIFPESNDIAEVNSPIAVILASLWSTDTLLAQYCEALLCSSRIYDFWIFSTLTVILNSTDTDTACLREASRNSALPNNTESFSIDISHTGKHLLFLVGNISQEDDLKVQYLSYIQFAKNYDPEAVRCCTMYTEHSHFDRILMYCFSLEESCQSLPFLWRAIEANSHKQEELSRNYIVMRPDVVHLSLTKSLAPLIREFPSLDHSKFDLINDNSSMAKLSNINVYKDFINWDYNYTRFEDYEIWVNKIKSQSINDMKMVIKELRNNYFECSATKYYYLCKKEHVFFIFVLEDCISTFSVSDEIVFLLVNHYLSQRVDSGYLCQNHSSVISTTGNEAYTNGHAMHFMILPSVMHQGTVFEPKTLYKGEFEIQNTSSISFEHTPFSNYEIQISKLNLDDKILPPTTQPSVADVESFTVMTKLFIWANVNNNTRCIQDVIDGKFSYRRNVSETIFYLVGPVYDDPSESKCLLDLSYKDLLIDKDVHSLTTNKFWPTCFTNMLMAININGIQVADWDYLPFGCKVQEILLLCLMIVIILVTVIGNLFVMVIIVASGLIQKQPFLIRFSLCVSDLLTGVIPSSLAVFDSVGLMTGWLSLTDLSHSDTLIYFAEKTMEQSEGFQQLRFERRGFYHVFSSIIMSVSIFVSIFSLSLISTENLLVIKRRPLKRWQVKLAIGISWFLGIAFSLLVQWREDGWSAVAYFDPITKLTLNIGAAGSKLSSVTFYIKVVLAGIGGACVLILTLISIITFRFQERRTQKKMPVHQSGRQDNVRQTTIIFFYMVALYALASVPPLLDILLDFSFSHPLLHFFCWWIFMAGSSWNWIIYAYKGKTFKSATKKASKRVQRMCCGKSSVDLEDKRYSISTTR
ncbi:uncharacterized protein LOC135198493 [Macrobrachium nipponense]|uniref:uncharacterized protein LOC135198493 n=1 Tax=Macrobrachium nipponense TaxID=159736 RepID=UPI0030C7CB43